MDDTEPVTAPRTTWVGLLELSRHTDMSVAERIMGVTVGAADYETKPFLTLRLKLIEAIQSCYDEEGSKRLMGEGNDKEASAEVDLTIAEATYLDMMVRVAEFKGALTLKRDLWRAISALYTKHRREKEAL